MRIDLYAKKINQRGHQFLNTVEVPNLRPDFRIPVRPQVSAMISEGSETRQQIETAVRIFEHKSYDNDGLIIGSGGNPAYFEK